MLEVEMKFPAPDFRRLRDLLAKWGAHAQPPLQEADHYFNAPDRDFAKTDEALRMRRIGSESFVTYKGPKLDQKTKTRAEIEVALVAGDAAARDFCAILVHLGYRPTAVVRKTRTIHRLDRAGFTVEICLDDVEDVGQFAELEIVAPEERLEAARETVLALATELGLTASERRSYLEMLLVQKGNAPP